MHDLSPQRSLLELFRFGGHNGFFFGLMCPGAVCRKVWQSGHSPKHAVNKLGRGRLPRELRWPEGLPRKAEMLTFLARQKVISNPCQARFSADARTKSDG